MYLARCSCALWALLLFPYFLVVSSSDIIPEIYQKRHETDGLELAEIHSSLSHSHAAPVLELNETEILLEHAPEPLSYWAHDFDETTKQWRTLMVLHVSGMIFSFFCVLPIGIVLRSARHPWHGATVLFFGVAAFLSSAAGSLYKKMTGDLYQNSVHGRHGFFVLALFLVLAGCDALAFLRRVASFAKGSSRRNIRTFWRSVVLNQEDHGKPEYTSLMHHDPDSEGTIGTKLTDSHQPSTSFKPVPHMESAERFDTSHSNAWDSMMNPSSSTSHHPLANDRFHRKSESTISLPLDSISHAPTTPRERDEKRHPRLVTIGRAMFTTAERSLLTLGLMQLMSGAVVYTGICRQKWIAGCIGHLIKGGITVCYGLVSFCRYVGLWSDIGWAWNKLPAHRRVQNIPTAEAVECLFFIFYGIVMTFTERIETEPGPFTILQLQHISIAIMFWVAGMLGLALESKTMREWVSPAEACAVPEEPAPQRSNHVGSFNPFPALVVGVTGVSISVHPQRYIFVVDLHVMWGHLFVGFAVLRCLTYFLLWIHPPLSVRPSRPPTEALASFSLTCGGLLLILSADQIEFAAMRRGYADVMLFFNFTVAVTYLAFFWVFSVITFKGWVTSRAQQSHPLR